MKKKTFIYLSLLLLGCFTVTVSFSQSLEASDQITCVPTQEEIVAIDEAKLYIEYNFTDDDIGVHGAFDSGGYSKLCVYDPNGTQILTVKPLGQFEDLTMGGIFFESREPPSSEFSYEGLMTNFPEGQYEVSGVTFEGKRLTGSATFSHDVPAAPTITFPLEDDVVPLTNLVVSWEPVTQTIKGDPVTITAYEIIITKEAEDDPNGFSRPTFDVHVPANRSNLTIPTEFLEPDTEYELEILALEESGNQTITISFFKVSEDNGVNNEGEDEDSKNGDAEDDEGEDDDEGNEDDAEDKEVKQDSEEVTFVLMPSLDPNNFVTKVTNPYFPLKPGTRYIYEAQTEDGLETIEVFVTHETREVMGVATTVVRDTVTIEGELIEDTFDWFAQDKVGNVWYFGEVAKNYEDGEFKDTSGSWEAGVNGAIPGIIMLANPQVNDLYRQEFYKDEAEDMAQVVNLGDIQTVPYGTFDDLLVTLDWNPLESDAQEHKYYAKGVGPVLETSLDGTERVELVEILQE